MHILAYLLGMAVYLLGTSFYPPWTRLLCSSSLWFFHFPLSTVDLQPPSHSLLQTSSPLPKDQALEAGLYPSPATVASLFEATMEAGDRNATDYWLQGLRAAPGHSSVTRQYGEAYGHGIGGHTNSQCGVD